jgi:hypothetical protein
MTNIDSRIKTAGAKVAKIQLEADKKPMAALFEGIASHVKTKEDIQAFLTGYAESLEHGGITTGSVKVMKSRANRIAQVMTATNKKLCEFHDVNTREDGIKLVAELMARPKAGGITAVFEALAPKLTDQEQGSEADTEAETGEPTEAEKSDIAKLFAGFVNNAHNNGYTNSEIMEYLGTVKL